MVPWIKNGTLAYARTLAKLRTFITLMVKNDIRVFAGSIRADNLVADDVIFISDTGDMRD